MLADEALRAGLTRPARDDPLSGRSSILEHVAPDPPPAKLAVTTWNAPDRIAAHRTLTHEQRLRLTIEASRTALRFANAPRRRVR